MRKGFKLVRDYIPGIMVSNGQKPAFATVDYSPFFVELLQDKLKEETEEVVTAMDNYAVGEENFVNNSDEFPPSNEEIAEELADLLEVIDTIRAVYHISAEYVNNIKEAKAADKGKFEKGIVLFYDC